MVTWVIMTYHHSDGKPIYWTGGLGSNRWSTFAGHAIQFARKWDAEEVIRRQGIPAGARELVEE